MEIHKRTPQCFGETKGAGMYVVRTADAYRYGKPPELRHLNFSRGAGSLRMTLNSLLYTGEQRACLSSCVITVYIHLSPLRYRSTEAQQYRRRRLTGLRVTDCRKMDSM